MFTTFFLFTSSVAQKMSKLHKPKPGKFLLEVSGVSNSAFSQWQDLGNNVILLPLSSPNLANIPFQTDVNQHAFWAEIYDKLKKLLVYVPKKKKGQNQLPPLSECWQYELSGLVDQYLFLCVVITVHPL